MEKTKYFAPECEEVKVSVEAQVLTGSSEDMGETPFNPVP